MSPKSNETLEEILNIHQDFCHEQCRKNSDQHAEFYNAIHQLDKDITIIAVRIGAISGTVATFVSWILTLLLPMPKG